MTDYVGTVTEETTVTDSVTAVVQNFMHLAPVVTETTTVVDSAYALVVPRGVVYETTKIVDDAYANVVHNTGYGLPKLTGGAPDVADPIVAPTVANDVVATGKPVVAAGTYRCQYCWTDASSSYTALSPVTAWTTDGTHSVSVTLPAPPAGATGYVIAFDNGLGSTAPLATVLGSFFIRPLPVVPVYLSVYVGLGLTLAQIDYQGRHIVTNNTGTILALGNAKASQLECTGVGIFDAAVTIAGGLGVFGVAPPATQSTISGTVTGGTLAQLQTVMTALLVALDAAGYIKKTTT